MKKYWNNERGLTLIELLAVLIIGGIILAFSTSLIIQAMNNQERITIEAQLRDEADMMMAQLTKAFFTLKESEIDKIDCGTLAITAPSVTPFDASSKQPIQCLLSDEVLTPETAAAVASSRATLETCKENCIPYTLITMRANPDINDAEACKEETMIKNVKNAVTTAQCERKIGFIGSTIFTKNSNYTITNKHVSLDPNITIEFFEQQYKKDGSTVLNAGRISVKIAFTLHHKVKGTKRTFQNEIVTVDDI